LVVKERSERGDSVRWELATGADKGMGYHWYAQGPLPYIGENAEEHWLQSKRRQLINGKRTDHYVRIVFRKSSAIVTVECGAETGVRGWGPASEVVLLSSNMIVAFFIVNQPYYHMLHALRRTGLRRLAVASTISILIHKTLSVSLPRAFASLAKEAIRHPSRCHPTFTHITA